MQLLEIIDYGPNTFGTDKKSGGNSENIGEIFRLRRKNWQTPLPAPHIARKKGRKKHTKNISPVFSQKKLFFRESPVFLAALKPSIASQKHLPVRTALSLLVPIAHCIVVIGLKDE